MAWTAPITFAPLSAVTGAMLNTYLRDNMLETGPAKATTPGGYFVSTAVNSIAERVVGHHSVLTSQNTTDNSYGDLDTVGPSVTVTTGSSAFCYVTGRLSNSGAGSCFISLEVSGATSAEPLDARALIHAGTSSNASTHVHIIELEPGVNTFTAKYRASSGTATFSNRRLVIMPL